MSEENQNPFKLLENFVPVAPQVFTSNGEQVKDYDYSNFQEDFQAGRVFLRRGDKVPVKSGQGQDQFDSEKIQQAFNEGYEFDSPEEQYKRALLSEYTTSSSQAKAAALGAARGLTIGISDPILESLGVNMEKVQALEQFNPALTTTGEILGMVAPAIVSAGAGAAATAARFTPAGAVSALGRGVERVAASTAAKVGGEAALKSVVGRSAMRAAPLMAQGAIEGAIYGAGNALSEDALGNADLTAEYLASEIGTGSMLGLGFGAVLGGGAELATEAGKVLKQAKDRIGDASLKGLSALFGVRPETAKAYLASKGSLGDDILQQYDETYLKIYDQIDDINSAVTSGKLSVSESKRAVDDVTRDLRDQLSFKKFDTEESIKATKQVLDDAKLKLTESIDNKMLQAGTSVSEDMNKLHIDVIEKSQKAMNELVDNGVVVDVSSVAKKIDDLANEAIKFQTSEGKLLANSLNDYKKELFEQATDGKLTGDLVKKRIQGIDKITDYNPNAASFDKLKNATFKQIRYQLDDALKTTSPAYKESMKEVAEDVRLLTSLKRYGDEMSSARSLRNIDDPVRMKYELAALKKLESKYGQSYSKDIERYINLDKEIANLPDFKKLESIKADYGNIKKKLSTPSIRKALESTPEMASLKEAEARYREAALRKAGIEDISPKSIKTIFRQAGMGDKISLRKVESLERVLENPGLTKLIQDAKILQDFEKGATTGSRMGLQWGAIGLLAGDLLASGSGLGTAAGVLLGGQIDKYGPKMFKGLLDQHANLSAVENIATRAAKKTADNIKKMFGVKTLGEAIQGRALPITIQNQDDDKKKEIKKVSKQTFSQINDIYGKFKDIATNDTYLTEKLNRETAEIAKFAPRTAASLQLKATQSVNFLKSKLPKTDTLEYGLKIKTRPSDYELSKFNKYWQAVDNPSVVFEALSEGIVIPEYREVMENVYPEMYADAKSAILENITDLQNDLPYDKRLALSQFFDAPLDPSTESLSILEMQNTFSPEVKAEMIAKAEGRSVEFTKDNIKSIKENSQRKLSETERMARES